MKMTLQPIFIFGLLALLLCSSSCDAVSTEEVPTSMEEVKEQLEGTQEAEDEEPGTALMQWSSVIYSGSTIALQTSTRHKWAGCSGKRCGTATCPGVYMDRRDYSNCWGEVFRIYRRRGRGPVRVGDYVGIYYSRERGKWLGCRYSTCVKATCPGLPNRSRGFANKARWHRCWGEVFKIYAKGKRFGRFIRHKDDIMLYYLRGRDWLSYPGGRLHHHRCPGRARPPRHYKYDRCRGEVFSIWKQGLTTNEL